MSTAFEKLCISALLLFALTAGAASADVALSNEIITKPMSFSDKDFVTISNCTFQDINSDYVLQFDNVKNVTITDSAFVHMTVTDVEKAVVCARGCGTIKITGTDFQWIQGHAIRLPYGYPNTELGKNGQIEIDHCNIKNVDEYNQIHETGVGCRIFQSDKTVITNCEIAYTQSEGLWLGRGNTPINSLEAALVKGCNIHHTMGDNILTQENAKNVHVIDNELSYAGYIYPGSRPMNGDHAMYYQCNEGGLIADNYIHHCLDSYNGNPDSLGISFRSGNLTIARNIVHDTTKTAIGYWSDHPGSGTVKIENNVVYNTGCNSANGPLKGVNAPGIYLVGAQADKDEVDNWEIYHNTVYIDKQYEDWRAVAPLAWRNLAQPCSATVIGNILCLDNGDTDPAHYISEEGTEPSTKTIEQNLNSPSQYPLPDLFEDYPNNNFHLKPGSPAIDFVTKYNVVTDDADGKKRPGNGQNDAGAYEFSAPAP